MTMYPFHMKTTMQEKFIALSTARLKLRSINLGDVNDLFDIRFHPGVLKYIRREKSSSILEMNTYINEKLKDTAQGRICYWGICKLESSKLIGTICLWNYNPDQTEAEIGYELHPDEHQKGYTSEAMSSVLDFGFSKLKFNTIIACTNKDNEPSKALLSKFDFKWRSDLEDEGFPDNLIYIKEAHA